MRKTTHALTESLSNGAVARLRLAGLLAAALVLGTGTGCGSADPTSIAIVVQVQSLTSTANKLVVTATLDGKAAMQNLDLTGDLTRFGVRLPVTLTGSLSLGISAYDSAQCKVAQGTVSVPLGAPYQFQVSVTMQTLATRECPPPVGPKSCSPATFCWASPLPQGNAYLSVWANSATDAWAVGPVGTIARYNGTSWSVVSSGVTTTLRSVWGSSPSDRWAVGDGGTILHYKVPAGSFRRC